MNTFERENLKASLVVDQRRATVHRAAKARFRPRNQLKKDEEVGTRALLTDTCEQPSLRKAPFLNDNLMKQCPFMLRSRHLPGSMDVPCRNGS